MRHQFFKNWQESLAQSTIRKHSNSKSQNSSLRSETIDEQIPGSAERTNASCVFVFLFMCHQHINRVVLGSIFFVGNYHSNWTIVFRKHMQTFGRSPSSKWSEFRIWLSMSINDYQCLSMSINVYQCLSMSINVFQWLKIRFRTKLFDFAPNLEPFRTRKQCFCTKKV